MISIGLLTMEDVKSRLLNFRTTLERDDIEMFA